MALTKTYYIYRHIRLDKNEVFYIGYGHYKRYHKNPKKQYHRAYRKIGRSNLWWNIVNKNNKKYEVEVIFKSNDKNEIIKKEKEFIKLYGRKNTNSGTLANLTDGGEGNHNLVVSDSTKQLLREINLGKRHSEETKKKISQANKKNPYWLNKNHSEETKKKISKNSASRGKRGADSYSAKIVWQFSKSGEFIKEWGSLTDIYKKLNFQISRISSCCNDHSKTAYGYVWKFKFDKEGNLNNKKINPESHRAEGEKRVYQYDKNMNFIKDWDNANQIEKELDIASGSVRNVCREDKLNKTAGGFIWKYKIDQ